MTRTKIYNLLILGKNLRNLDSGFNRFNEHWILSRTQILDENAANETKWSTRRQPRLRRILTTCDSVSSSLFGGVISTCGTTFMTIWGVYRKRRKTLVMQTTIGTLSARATARCSFDMPMTPALAPITRITQDGAPDVKPYNVVLRYRSCPARSSTWL